MYFGEVESLSDGKEKSSQRMSFCAIIIQLNLPNFYLHTLFFYYIILCYLISTQTEKIVTTIRLDISLLQLLVSLSVCLYVCLSLCLSVSMVQSYFTSTKYFKKTNILQFNRVHFYVMFIVTKFHKIWYDNFFAFHFSCISSYT